VQVVQELADAGKPGTGAYIHGKGNARYETMPMLQQAIPGKGQKSVLLRKMLESKQAGIRSHQRKGIPPSKAAA
jgi:hypothetical protein